MDRWPDQYTPEGNTQHLLRGRYDFGGMTKGEEAGEFANQLGHDRTSYPGAEHRLYLTLGLATWIAANLLGNHILAGRADY